MVSFSILAGGYDLFIASYIFNNVTSSLTLHTKYPSGSNPSWITLNPVDHSVLYAVNEIDSGQLQSYTIHSNGALSTAVDTISSGGGAPAFAVALSSGSVAVMNYNGGNGRIIPTTSGMQKFDGSAPLITFPHASGAVSHPHMALQYNDEVLVPDLGGDTIWRLKQSSANGPYTIQGSIPQPKGSGPRHIAIHNDRLFILHELSSTLSVQSIPASPNGTATTYATTSIVPPNPPAGAMMAAAEILIPESSTKFPTSYIYVSNRNKGIQGPKGDSIAIFEHVNKGCADEGLKLINQVFTGLNQIRGMEFGNAKDGGDEYLIAGGSEGASGVIVLKRVEGGRNLEIVATNKDIPTRTGFVWL